MNSHHTCRKKSYRVGVAAVLATALLWGCNKKEGAESEQQPTRTYLIPNRVFTGFDGQNQFQAVIATNLVDPTIEISDPTVVTVQRVEAPTGFTDTFYLVTSIGPGQATITARAGEKDADTVINVEEYAPEQIAIGRERYNQPLNENDTTRQSCAGCHQAEGGHDHSPFTVGGFDTQDILSAIETGIYLHQQQLTIDGGELHEWDLTDEEKEGIVPFLRTLPVTGMNP